MHDFDDNVEDREKDYKALRRFIILFLTGFALAMLFVILTGCGGGSLSGGGASDRVGLTDKDRQAIAEMGGMDGPWLGHVSEIVRLDREPPSGTKWAQAPCPHFVLYRTSLQHPDLVALFAHEAAHVFEGCKSGSAAEQRAVNFRKCYQSGQTVEQCKSLLKI